MIEIINFMRDYSVRVNEKKINLYYPPYLRVKIFIYDYVILTTLRFSV